MSLALIAVFNRLIGSCKVGVAGLDWQVHKDPPTEEAPAEGDIGGVEVGGTITDGEPRASGVIDVISNDDAPLEYDLGERTADPVEGYKGRSSSGLWAKKQTLLLQFVSSLHIRVRYCAG